MSVVLMLGNHALSRGSRSAVGAVVQGLSRSGALGGVATHGMSASNDLRTVAPCSIIQPSFPGAAARGIQTDSNVSKNDASLVERLQPYQPPGSLAFADCEFEAIADLFYHFAHRGENSEGSFDDHGSYLSVNGVRRLLKSIGERPDDNTLKDLFEKADLDGSGKLSLNEFLMSADRVLGGSPARTVLIVGGPGSGKGILSQRLANECGSVHLSSGDLLRDEVARGTPLGRECAEIMARGDLVSSKIITALVRRHARSFPGRRILLDGFPRSLENATDFVKICGNPELALHLDCDDTILMERILNRAKEGQANGTKREDDSIEIALKRLRTFHKYHHPTIEWLREQSVPIVNLDCSKSPENVWNQLLAIGRLMRPAVAYKGNIDIAKQTFFDLDSPSEASG